MNCAIKQEWEHKRLLRPGYSITELLIVIGVVAILLAGLGYLGTTLMESAKKRNTGTAMQTINLAITEFYRDTNQYPNSLKDLTVKPQSEGFEGWDGPYLTKGIPKSGWGSSFSYRLTPDGKNPYDLTVKSPKGNTLSVWNQ